MENGKWKMENGKWKILNLCYGLSIFYKTGSLVKNGNLRCLGNGITLSD